MGNLHPYFTTELYPLSLQIRKTANNDSAKPDLVVVAERVGCTR
jgi:hypothetical protein